MKWRSFLFMAVLLATGPTVAGAYSQADVDRLLAGDKNMQNADLSVLPRST